MLLTSLGLVIVLSPEPLLVMSSFSDENVLETTNKIVQETLPNVEEKPKVTKETFVKDAKVVTKPIEKSVGWFRKKSIADDHFDVAKDKAKLAKESIQEASIELKDGALEKLNSKIESTKGKASNIYNETGNQMFHTIQLLNSLKFINILPLKRFIVFKFFMKIYLKENLVFCI